MRHYMASLVVFALLLTGCTMRLIDFTMISSKNVKVPGVTYGQRTVGKDCAPYILFIPVKGRWNPHMKEAIDKAIEAAGPEYDALLDGVVDQNWVFTYIFNMVCYEVKGTPINTKKVMSSGVDLKDRVVYHHSSHSWAN